MYQWVISHVAAAAEEVMGRYGAAGEEWDGRQ